DGKGYRNRTALNIKALHRPAFGGFVTIPSHKVIENLAVAKKLDFVWLEAEHSSFGPGEVEQMALAAENEGLTPIVRVPANEFNLIKKYIGTGVQGVVVPSIKTAQDAKNAVKAIKYAPEGERAAGAERANRYLGNFADYKQRANSEMLVILMIETREAVENIEEIIKVPGIDILHLGPYDLSLSYGVEMQNEILASAIRKVEMAAARHKMPLGSYAPTMKHAEEKIAKGYRFFTIPGDMEYLQNGVKNFFE
ncbi:MAG: aldolase/citrate lyase family protein, partial [Candidatus Riflebacteria bacterium]